MWKNLYDTFLQLMTITWGEFIRANGSSGKIIRDNFQNRIYPEIGIYLVIAAAAGAIIYYYYFNLRFGRYYTLAYWIAALVLSAVFAGVISWFMANSILDGPAIDVSRHVRWLSIINGVYTGILFIAISLLIKWGSPMGKRTPI